MESIEEKGARGEARFTEWLDSNGLGYINIKQDTESYAKLFGQLVKRPDYLVLLESIGLIAVDVKNYTLSRDSHYTLDLETEIKKVLAFERLFKLPVWYAYMGDEQGSTWYWLSALRAVEVGKATHTKSDKIFLRIARKEFVSVSTRQEIGRLWSEGIEPARKMYEMENRVVEAIIAEKCGE